MVVCGIGTQERARYGEAAATRIPEHVHMVGYFGDSQVGDHVQHKYLFGLITTELTAILQ